MRRAASGFPSRAPVACGPGTPLVGMVTYRAAVTLYLAYVGVADGLSGHYCGRRSSCT